jgi:hypothetical protein
VEVVDMVSPYLTQVLAEEHVDDLRRAACRTRRTPRRSRRSAFPKLREWWAGQLHRPATSRAAILPGRPATLSGCAGR